MMTTMSRSCFLLFSAMSSSFRFCARARIDGSACNLQLLRCSAAFVLKRRYSLRVRPQGRYYSIRSLGWHRNSFISMSLLRKPLLEMISGRSLLTKIKLAIASLLSQPVTLGSFDAFFPLQLTLIWPKCLLVLAFWVLAL